jgi:RNA-directed DNA polymerase
MKRQRIDLAAIAARDNLALAAYKAARGKRRHADVACFISQLDASLRQLAHGILAGTVPLGGERSFVIRDPKRRSITAPCFQDRVLHHAIFNLAEPRLEAALADSAFACRPGRGVHAAVRAVQAGLVRWPWVVQVDVEHCFDNIDHAVLLRLLARRFKGDDFLGLLARIVCSHPSTSPMPTWTVPTGCWLRSLGSVPWCATWTTSYGSATAAARPKHRSPRCAGMCKRSCACP